MVGVTLALLAAGPSTAARRPAPPKRLTCYACLAATGSGEVLWARNADVRLPNASTTKMLTALVVVRRASLDDEVRVSGKAARTGGGGLELRARDRYDVEELLRALLMTSSNDAAVSLAEHVSGSEAAFVEEMNELASRLGARRTHSVTAHGLDAPGHYSTARDLAKIAAALLERPSLARIVRSRRSTIDGPRGSEVLKNRNLLLGSYRGAIGVKTGYTVGAGNVLVAAAERGSRHVVAVAMRSQDAAKDARRLLDYGFARLQRAILLRRDTVVAGLVFDPAGATGAGALESVHGIAGGEGVDVRFVPDATAQPPLQAGDAVGRIVLRSAGGTTEVVDAVATHPIDRRDAAWTTDALSGLLRLAHEAVALFRLP